MTNFAKEIIPVSIESELKQSYLDYAMSVIVGRALPDVRDGLKPVHRRVLFAMHELSNDFDKPYKKSARVVGDVIGKYHPHGDVAVYDAIVRMAQPFSMRYMLVDGQGNFGSVDGDSPAAMRYTEVRMAKISHFLLADLGKETVDFMPNYDGSEMAPTVLPARVPNLLINGSAGIAVGMATNIPPHNLSEVIRGCIALIDNADLTIEELIRIIPGPDFPTYGIIHGREGILDAYKTGRGRVRMRARTSVETDEDSGKLSIIITEIPYQVNKARLVEKIAELAKDKKIEGITAVRDESDKDGMRIVLELRRGEPYEIILNNLFIHTTLQSAFNVNMVALVDGRPRTLNLKQMLEAFLQHRREVVTRRCIYELRKARERAHLLEGLSVALSNIDEMVQLIKASPTPQDAKNELMARQWNAHLVKQLLSTHRTSAHEPLSQSGSGLQGDYYQLSLQQAEAILELRLQRLTALEQNKIHEEYKNLLSLMDSLLEILANPVRLMEVIREELEEVNREFGDSRRTSIEEAEGDLNLEDLISDEAMVLTLSHQGYVKSQPVTSYTAQHRGGKGKAATQVKDEDFVEQLLIATKHQTILCFSSIGKVYWLKGYQFPEAARVAKGRPMVNLLPLVEGERIQALLPVRQFDDGHYILMITANGVVKKTPLTEFSRPRTSGIIALDLVENDKLVSVNITDGQQDVMLFSNGGKAIRFKEADIRSMGRGARGVRGIRLLKGQHVIAGFVIQQDSGTLLIVTENGYGKCTNLQEFRTIGRGGQGVLAIPTAGRNGLVVGALHVNAEDEIMVITDRGTLVRTRVAEISTVGRAAQGVRVIHLSASEKVMCIEGVKELADSGDDLEIPSE